MTKLAPVAQRAFDAWIEHETWYGNSDQDLARFHAFVWAVVRYSRRSPDESEIKDLICQRWNGQLYRLDDYARGKSSLFKTLYDFGIARKAPGVASRAVENFVAEAHAQNRR